MSILAALTTVLLFSGFSLGQIDWPGCTDHTWEWTYNSLDQNACGVAAYLQSTCWEGSFTVPALPLGYEYSGPTVRSGNDLCKCNTVTYSLLSACGACQGELWISWSEWAYNCTKVLPPSTFPNAVPLGTRVPQWALRDVTLDLDSFWDSVRSLGVGDSPEIGPGALIGVSSSTTGAGPTPGGSPNPTTFPGPGSSPLSASTSSPSYGSSSSGRGSLNTGVIVGAAVGGTSVIALAILASIYLRKSRPTPPSAAVVVGYGASLQPPHDVKMPLPPDDRSHDASSLTLQTQTPIPPMRVYSPNESSRSSVYPEYQEAPSPRAPEVSALPTSFSAYKVTNIPATEQGEYHGLPIV